MHTLRIRGKGYPATGFSPINNTYPIAIWDSDDLQLHVWLEAESYSGTSGTPYNIDDITSLAMEMRATPDTSAMLIEAKTTSSFTACTLDEFINGTGQHATFTFTDTDTNVASTLDQVWISLVATLDDGSRYTFAAGYVQVIHSGADQSAVVDAVDTYARYTFKTISVSGQSDVVADTATDTLTFAGSNGVVITTSAGTDTVTFSLGAITPTSINGLTITTSTGTLTVTNGKTLSVSNTLTLAGTDGSTLNVGAGGTLGSAAFTASSAYQPASSTYVTAASALASTDNCIIRGDASSTRGVQTTEWLIDDTGAMSYTLIGDELTALNILSLGTNATTLSVTADGTGAVALDGAANGTNGVGVQGSAAHGTGVGVRGYGTASGSVGVLAHSSHASAIPLQLLNSGGFRVSITSAATANRSQILPDAGGVIMLGTAIDNSISRGNGTTAVQPTSWSIDDNDQMIGLVDGAGEIAIIATSTGEDGFGLYVEATGDGGKAIEGRTSNSSGVGVSGVASESGGVGIVAVADHSGATPLKVQNSGGFQSSITNSGTANRGHILPDATGTLALQEWVESALKAFRIGTISMYAGASAPTGALLCNGATVSQATYALLFAIIGHTFGADPGGGNFILPNLVNRMPVGAGGTYALGATGGESSHALTASEAPDLVETALLQASGTEYAATATYGVDGDAHNNMPPYLSVSFVIWTGL